MASSPIASAAEIRLPDWLSATPLPPAPASDAACMAFAVAAAGENVARGTGGPFSAVIRDDASGEIVSVGVNLAPSVATRCCTPRRWRSRWPDVGLKALEASRCSPPASPVSCAWAQRTGRRSGASSRRPRRTMQRLWVSAKEQVHRSCAPRWSRAASCSRMDFCARRAPPPCATTPGRAERSTDRRAE